MSYLQPGLRKQRKTFAGCAEWILPLAFLMPAAAIAAESSIAILPLLEQISQIRRLSPEEANRHYPAKLRGVVTYFDKVAPNLFIQDGADCIWVRWNPKTAAPSAGDLVEIEGTTSLSGFAPFIEETNLRPLGHAAMPEPTRPSLDQMTSSMEDSRWIEVQGIVRSARLEEGSGGRFVTLAIPGGEIW